MVNNFKIELVVIAALVVAAFGGIEWKDLAIAAISGYLGFLKNRKD